MKIAIVIPDCYAVIDPESKIQAGGAELRAWTFAKGLARNPKNSVTVLVEASPAIRFSSVEHVNIRGYKLTTIRLNSLVDRHCELFRKYWPKGRVLPKRLSLLLFWHGFLGAIYLLARSIYFSYLFNPHRVRINRVYEQLDSDIVVTFMNSMASAEAIKSARRYGRKIALFLAADIDVSAEYLESKPAITAEGRSTVACRYALENADLILVQNRIQQRQLKERFQRDSVLVRNPISMTEDSATNSTKREFILWVGRSDRHHKRPLIMLEIVKRCPAVQFVMICNPREPDVHKIVLGANLTNLTVIEWVPPDRMREFFSKAVAFVTTAAFEGFPNVLLQCAKYRTPFLALDIDPDNVLSEHQAGFCARGDMESLVCQIKAVWENPPLANGMVERLRDYALANHSEDRVVAEMDRVLAQTCFGE